MPANNDLRSRIEILLDACINATSTSDLPQPESRVDEYLLELVEKLIQSASSIESLARIVQALEVIVSGKPKAEVFDIFSDMQSWLQDIGNKDVLRIGDILYIKEDGVSDFWVSDVLENPDPVTGYYYNIESWESKIPDISNMATTNTAQDIIGNKNFIGELKKNNVNVVGDNFYIHTDNNYTNNDKEKLENIEEGAQVNSNAVLSGIVPPTNTIIGFLGQIYIDTVTEIAYQCTNIDNDYYSWVKLGGCRTIGWDYTSDSPQPYLGLSCQGIQPGDTIILRGSQTTEQIALQKQLDIYKIIYNEPASLELWVNNPSALPTELKIYATIIHGLYSIEAGITTINCFERQYVVPNDLNNYYSKSETDALLIDKIDTSFIVADNHRNIYRGKNLGTSVTAEQQDAIASGTFNDLYVGDYWIIDGVTYRIADIDYWYNCGDTAFTRHHLVIVPDSNLYNARMNETNTTTGGYVGSEMYTTNLEQAKTTIQTAFGDKLLTHRNLLVNAVSSGGYPSAGAWLDSTVELMNEPMVYGSYIFTPGGNGSMIPYRYTIDKQQLSLFRLNPKMINRRSYYWLRDVVSAARFALVTTCGDAYYFNASSSFGVRPVFAIG